MVGWISRNGFVDLKKGSVGDVARKVGEMATSLAKEVCEGRNVKDISHSVLTYAPFDFAVVTVIGREE